MTDLATLDAYGVLTEPDTLERRTINMVHILRL